MRKECKRHRWRVGSGNGELVHRQIESTSLNIWCEKCDKKIKAYYHSSSELKKLKSVDVMIAQIKKESEKIKSGIYKIKKVRRGLFAKFFL